MSILDWIWAILIAVLGLTLSIWGAYNRIPDERKVRRILTQIIGSAVTLVIVWGAIASEQLRGTAAGVIVALLVSGILFVGANKWFDLVETSWSWFASITGAVSTGSIATILFANQILVWRTAPEPEGTNYAWVAVLVSIILGGVFGWLLSNQQEVQQRLFLGLLLGLTTGVLGGSLVNETSRPEIRIGSALLWTLIGALLFGSVTWLLQQNRNRATRKGSANPHSRMAANPYTIGSWMLLGAGLGWLEGAWVMSDLGAGSRIETVLAVAIGAMGIGLWVGLRPPSTYESRRRLGQKSRAFIFLAPALGFVLATLVIPTVRTIYLSFLGPFSQERVGFRNYSDVFSDPGIVELSGWSGIFGSRLLWWGVGLAILGALVGIWTGRSTGRRWEPSGTSITPIVVGAFLLSWAVFGSLRGTIFNNLWWVLTVTLLASAMGLAIAVLADRARFESVAKSFIFMPMAISFVGAGIIWRFMYIARPPTKNQTGVMNTIWVGLGQLTNSSWPKWIAVILLLGLIAGLAWLAWTAYKGGSNTVAIFSSLTTVPVLWFIYRLLGPGLGGYEIGPGDRVIADPIIFLTEGPFNNVWMMVVLIWIQTGFTMVIFSAAIKAVPSDLIEAARVDGATESQTFWRVTIPQIAPTIGVVVTTLIVLVTKVFDIVKVMTNGNFDTQVLANEMWQRAFTEFNVGLGSALAVLLFISVLPIMYINIRRMQKQAA